MGAADEELLSRYLDGDERAFEELVVRYEARVRNLVIRLLKDYSLAEDVAQETFLTVHRRARNFRGSGTFRSWLFRIAINRAQDELRRRNRRREVELERDRPWPEPAARTHEGLDARWDTARALDALRPEHRLAIVLREVEGLSYREIAETLGWPLGTVQARIHRGRLELRALLEEKDALPRR
ncbi:MAG TPA: sigma-70 family RNA polymerase sigma factor [Vicinamibacteria bacterium]|nr:sigma-70 family RNA polymerase sigma factor [Vicinamibacteria bacterium]